MEKSESDSGELLERWYDGDRQALETLLQRNIPWIQGYVRRRLGSLLRAKAESCDFVQEVVVEFLKYGPRFRVNNGKHLRALLGRIAENVMRGQHQRFVAQRRLLHRERPLPRDSVLHLDGSLEPVRRPSEAAQQQEWQALVRFALELLEAEQREVILMREWEELPFAELGRTLGISEDAARMRYHRALARLADNILRIQQGKLGELLDTLPEPE